MGTIIVLAVLILLVGLAVRSMIRDKKNGKSLQCGCSCEHCGGCCGSKIEKTAGKAGTHVDAG